ncbi:hypothetical protein G7043_29740 [Lentzea sp. NEAU-D13]|uniref:Uncharacterized protein n=1 Tax=Lentzea alba TaxID=2714351 RepID=A0A7C9RUE3_9PSEU|nr:hypothetical protein [Lentzea alba]NGY63109.1 hypothetical protein [Lentzea alba]
MTSETNIINNVVYLDGRQAASPATLADTFRMLERQADSVAWIATSSVSCTCSWVPISCSPCGTTTHRTWPACGADGRDDSGDRAAQQVQCRGTEAGGELPGALKQDPDRASASASIRDHVRRPGRQLCALLGQRYGEEGEHTAGCQETTRNTTSVASERRHHLTWLCSEFTTG